MLEKLIEFDWERLGRLTRRTDWVALTAGGLGIWLTDNESKWVFIPLWVSTVSLFFLTLEILRMSGRLRVSHPISGTLSLVLGTLLTAGVTYGEYVLFGQYLCLVTATVWTTVLYVKGIGDIYRARTENTGFGRPILQTITMFFLAPAMMTTMFQYGWRAIIALFA